MCATKILIQNSLKVIVLDIYGQNTLTKYTIYIFLPLGRSQNTIYIYVYKVRIYYLLVAYKRF